MEDLTVQFRWTFCIFAYAYMYQLRVVNPIQVERSNRGFIILENIIVWFA